MAKQKCISLAPATVLIYSIWCTSAAKWQQPISAFYIRKNTTVKQHSLSLSKRGLSYCTCMPFKHIRLELKIDAIYVCFFRQILKHIQYLGIYLTTPHFICHRKIMSDGTDKLDLIDLYHIKILCTEDEYFWEKGKQTYRRHLTMRIATAMHFKTLNIGLQMGF